MGQQLETPATFAHRGNKEAAGGSDIEMLCIFMRLDRNMSQKPKTVQVSCHGMSSYSGFLAADGSVMPDVVHRSIERFVCNRLISLRQRLTQYKYYWC
jgi:hypothetical protein